MTNIINYGVSESLKALFAQLKETPGLQGRKYPAKEVDLLSQDIVCRNYGSSCYELCYLCWAVVNHPNYATHPLLQFFWVQENIQPRRFRQAFEKKLALPCGQMSMGEQYLQLQLIDGEFAISPTRIGVLALMLEFIVSIDPSQLDKIQQRLLNGNMHEVKQLSSDLQKCIYSYLKEHLPEASTQERFRAISAWLDKKGLSHQQLTDQHVLDFWLCPPEQASYIKYSTVLEDLLYAVDAIEVVNTRFNQDYALSLGSDIEQGQVNLDWVQNTLFEQQQEKLDFSWLCQTPKFLTLAQYQPLKSLLPHWQMFGKLPLSFLRLGVFSPWQSVLVQAKRRSSLAVQEKLDTSPQGHYQQYIAQLKQLQLQGTDVQRAIAHIFYCLKSPLFTGIMAKHLSASLQKALRSWTGQQLEETEADTLATSGFAMIQAWLLQHPEAQAWLKTAEKAYKANNKEGFKVLPCAQQLDIYHEGVQALDQIHRILSGYFAQLDKFNRENVLLETIYRSDLCIFTNRFKQLYGDPNVG
jgi:hypothetical protein